MNVPDLAPLDEIASSLEARRDGVVATIGSGRQRLSDVDLVGVSRHAIDSARDAIPAGWPGHVRRSRSSRWPWVALLIVGVTMLGFLFVVPALRRSVPVTAAPTEPPATADSHSAVDPGIAAEDAGSE